MKVIAKVKLHVVSDSEVNQISILSYKEADSLS